MLTADGVLSVTINGMSLMQLLRVDNWDIPHGVSFSDKSTLSEIIYAALCMCTGSYLVANEHIYTYMKL